MKRVLIEPNYLPSLEYFCSLLPFDEIILEKNEHFVKQTYRNRCYINTAHGVSLLTIPLKGEHAKAHLKDIRIDFTKKWQNNHWRTLESAYRKAPFFEHYEESLHRILYKRSEFLFDLNRELLSFCLQSLSLSPRLSETLAYEKTPDPAVKDLRSLITPKKPFADRPYYQPRPHYQVFGNTFVPNLSVVDLLFCEGPRGNAILWASAGISNK